jgi:hypothetical protein
LVSLSIGVLLALSDRDAWQSERQPRIVLYLPRVHLIHVEGRVGHHVIALFEEIERIFVIGERLADVALKAMHGEVHLGEVDGGLVLFETAEGKLFGGTLVTPLDDVGALHEHAPGTAGWIKDGSSGRFQHIGDERDE